MPSSVRRPPPRCSLLAPCIALAIAGGCGDDGAAADGDAGDSTSAEGTAGSAGTGATATTQSADTSGGMGMTASDADTSAGGVDDTTTTADTGSPGIACIDAPFVNGGSPVGNYAESGATIGAHCQGTDHQDIADIERVVFIGDSVTVGTPPTGSGDFFRSILAQSLATQFGLEPPSGQWQNYNPVGGTAAVQESGAFASCAVWGARNDDLLTQLESCFTADDYQQRTLVVFTMGGNDGAAIAKDYLDGVPLNEVLAELDAMVLAHEQAIEWLVGDAGKFPNGVFVVNANVYEFTDTTFEFLSCPTAGLAGFNSDAEMPAILLGSLQHINEEYMRIATEHGTDVVFMSEGFCGHGFRADDPESPCYRGPGNESWFDLTCIHPTAAGHAALAEMFVNVIGG